MILESQLTTYVKDTRSKDEFLSVREIVGLVGKMLEMKKDGTYPFVYKLMKLAMTLPTVTKSVEKAFATMTIIKNTLLNKMGSQWLNYTC